MGSQEISLEDDEEEKQKQISIYRNKEINSLVENIVELSEIFKELNTLVVTQGTILDRIDYNLQMAAENTKKGNAQLIKAQKHQKCTRASSCILLLILAIFVLLITLGLKIYL